MIYGRRIRLRHTEREDLPLFVAWINDPEVRQGLALYLPLSQAEEEHWFENMLQRPVEERPLTIEIHQEEGWRTIGNSGYTPLTGNHSAGGRHSDRRGSPCWNRGGTEAMHLLVDTALTR
jgi:RimJ/RimL family protein N-acetyltransferase